MLMNPTLRVPERSSIRTLNIGSPKARLLLAYLVFGILFWHSLPQNGNVQCAAFSVQ
jgi:hypothetical protein